MKNLRHIVLLSFSATSTKEEIKKVEDAFNQLPSKIPGIKGYEWGINNSPEGANKGFTHAYFITFHTEAARNEYITDPSHLAFKALMKPYVNDVLVVDYWPK